MQRTPMLGDESQKITVELWRKVYISALLRDIEVDRAPPVPDLVQSLRTRPRRKGRTHRPEPHRPCNTILAMGPGAFCSRCSRYWPAFAGSLGGPGGWSRR